MQAARKAKELARVYCNYIRIERRYIRHHQLNLKQIKGLTNHRTRQIKT